MNLFQLGDFTLNSGKKSRFKIECDAWTKADIECLAYLIYEMTGKFSTVVGVPTGGLKLAEALEQYCTSGINRHLIVDDVLTTGGSMERLRSAYKQALGIPLDSMIMGRVVFARGPRPAWIQAVFQMPPLLCT